MTVSSRPQTSCEPHRASLYQLLALTGRYRSGQTGQTVNLLALRLRWFESSPAQILSRSDGWPAVDSKRDDWEPSLLGRFSGLFAGHLPGDHRIRRRRSRAHRRLRAVVLLAVELHSRLRVGLRSPDH